MAARCIEFEADLTPSQHDSIGRGVREGLRAILQGRYQDYDADGLRGLAKELIAASALKRHAAPGT